MTATLLSRRPTAPRLHPAAARVRPVTPAMIDPADIERWQPLGACGNNQAFYNSFLDYSPNDPEYADFSPIQHQMASDMRRRAEDDCVEVCMGCPVMLTCEAWSLTRAIPGVSGGRTEQERADIRKKGGLSVQSTTVADETMASLFIDRGPRGKVDDEVVARMTLRGANAARIAMHLGCAERTVVRARRRIADAAVATAPAVETITTAEVTAIDVPAATAVAVPEPARRMTHRDHYHAGMQAIYDVLADGGWHSRKELVAAGLPFISDEEAEQFWFGKNTTPNSDGTRAFKPGKATVDTVVRVAVGARDKVNNMLSASARNVGYTLRGGLDGNDREMYRLHPTAVAEWNALPTTTELDAA